MDMKQNGEEIGGRERKTERSIGKGKKGYGRSKIKRKEENNKRR